MSAENAALARLDRAVHVRKDVDLLEAQLRAGDSLFVPVWREQSLVSGARAALVRAGDARGLLDLGGELVWLGTVGGAGCFAIDVSTMADPLAHQALAGVGEFKDLRFAGPALPANEVNLLAYARGILYWHGRHLHCGVCGGRTAPREGGHLRVCRNQDCATQHFPRTDPAMIVLVRDGDECLLGRQKRFPAGMYSTLAGFIEPGESIEEAVVREVREESGVQVDDVRYFNSQPWPYPSSLMIGFNARATSREVVLDDELEDARWFSREQLRDPRAHGFFVPPGPFSLSGQLIAAFVNEAR
jgi:NAD+ diphosphatase